jgi:hypothetical protein
MDLARILLWAPLVFFCLWSALLARLKGYSAICWLLSGGAVGVLVLCLLPSTGPGQLVQKRRCNLLGLAISALSILSGWLLSELL